MLERANGVYRNHQKGDQVSRGRHMAWGGGAHKRQGTPTKTPLYRWNYRIKVPQTAEWWQLSYYMPAAYITCTTFWCKFASYFCYIANTYALCTGGVDTLSVRQKDHWIRNWKGPI